MTNKSNRVSWSFKEPQNNILLKSQDCDEVHITRDTFTIIYGKNKKEFDTHRIKDVTFYSYLKPPRMSLNAGDNLNE